MKHCASWLASTAVVATLLMSTSASALPAYSFEVGLDGFFGLGASVSAEGTLGVTDGTTSMKYAVAAGGFVGARTETVIPAGLNNPPGVQSIMFDMYIPEIPRTLTFADIGITLFGHDIDGGVFGVQSQFLDTVSIAGLGVGQHLNLVIDLDWEIFSGGSSFNELYGDDVSDLDVVSAFQFYITKTTLVPLTVYIDNVRLVGSDTEVPEPATGLLLAGAATMLGVAARRRKSAQA